MRDETSTLRDRVLVLLEQVDRDRASLQGLEFTAGRAICDRLFDSLTATLHNLSTTPAVEQRGE